MHRRTLSLLVGCALLAACGSSQSLPGQNAPLSPGYMRLTLHVAGPFDFARYQYEIVLNTSGNGLTPEFGQHTQWSAYSDAIKTSVANSKAYAEMIQFTANPQNPHLPPAQTILAVSPAQFTFDANGNGAGTAFTVTFQRSVLGANGNKVANVWTFNAATLAGTSLEDSMGRCGACFTSPNLVVNTTFDRTVDAAGSSAPAPARIVDVGVQNHM